MPKQLLKSGGADLDIEKQERGKSLHQSMISRSATKRWSTGQGKKGNLSFLKMKANENLKHPRIVVKGEPSLIPLCVDTGRLINSFGNKIYGLDDLGIAVSIYFKILKSFIVFFFLCSVVCIPLFFLYSCGDMSKQATGSIQESLSVWTLGNLGESSLICKKNNLRLYDTIPIWCPAGTKIKTLEEFGLQKVDAKNEDNQCPQLVDEQEKNKLMLDLDEQCSLEGLKKEFLEYYQTMVKQFSDNCRNREYCDMYVRNVDWPAPCREKIGIRLEVKNIPIIRQVNVSTVDSDVEYTTPEVDGISSPKGSNSAHQPPTPPALPESSATVDTAEPVALRSVSSTRKEDRREDQTAQQKQGHEGGDKASRPNRNNTADQKKDAHSPVRQGNGTSSNRTASNQTACTANQTVNCSTTTVSTIIEYIQAYEYVISDKSSSFFLYAVAECSNE